MKHITKKITNNKNALVKVNIFNIMQHIAKNIKIIKNIIFHHIFYIV